MKFDGFGIVIILMLIFIVCSFFSMIWNDEGAVLRRAARVIDFADAYIVWKKFNGSNGLPEYYGKERSACPQSLAGYRVYLMESGWVAKGYDMYVGGLQSSDEAKRVCEAHNKQRKEKIRRFSE